ncbi:MAG: hypothetical protein OJJ21_23310 [Ferrovibrio sp.]|uniref:hypothetical protein n=1 Tax=Ferrovibrio sp. TaxID=1917215 RepID=UPI0026085C91|nr:hypothetical protein [Ferrovibrio sp.]MCW0236545.1 hypothetical protein [Ferrovibrio sp.]
MRAVALSLALLLAPASVLACADLPVQARLVEGSHFRLVVLPDPMPIPLNAPFALDIKLCDARMAELPRLSAVDAWMPAHRHGMNYMPKLAKLDWGHYRAEGLLLHMPGEWEFVFDFAGPDKPERLSFRFDAQ